MVENLKLGERTAPRDTSAPGGADQKTAARMTPLTLEDVLSAALDRLEDFLLDIYEHGRSIGDPHVLWADGATHLLQIVIDGSPLARRSVD